MGGAYTALASDLCFQINPAGLGQTDFEVAAGACVNNLELISASGSDDVWQIAADEDLKLHGQAGLRIGGFGLGAFANAALMKQVDAESGDDIVVQDINGRASIGYGTRLTELFNLRIGGSVDVIQGRQDVFYADTNTATIESRIDSEWQGYSVNAGLMAKVGPLRAGLAVNDIYSSIDKKRCTPLRRSWTRRIGLVLLGIDAITLAADYEHLLVRIRHTAYGCRDSVIVQLTERTGWARFILIKRGSLLRASASTLQYSMLIYPLAQKICFKAMSFLVRAQVTMRF